ncbi:MAG: hypothetical protein ABSE28_00505 [Candidatus Sulfotelmatobacter sp.]|jgi:CubicO group peptidase (beta-lactamase class C family)
MQLNRHRFPGPRFSCWVHLALLIAFCCVVCAAQESELSSGKLAQIDAAVSKFISTTQVPGLSVAVVENGEYEWAQGLGVAAWRTTFRRTNTLCLG